jgi:hypothetical protein
MRKLMILFVVLLAACAGGPEAPAPAEETIAWYTGMQQENLGGYHATFVMEFTGEQRWTYRLDTRSDGRAMEHMLHVEGLNDRVSPGDVRLVSRDGISRMNGTGTDGHCVQFPSHLSLGPAFLNPDDLVSPALVGSLLTGGTESVVGGTETNHFSAAQPMLDGWSNAQVDLWWDPDALAILQYDLSLSGRDPMFEAGIGQLTARYQVVEIGEQIIEPVPGCNIDLPIPNTAVDIIKMPGMVAFQSTGAPQELVAYYQQALPGEGWSARNDPLQGPDSTVLLYGQGERTLEVNIKTGVQGVTVELFSGG